MNSSSKVIMAATLVMVVSLAMVLGLVLVLLAELYCSLLLRRRSRRQSSSNLPTTAAVSAASGNLSTAIEIPNPLNNVYTQGVLQTPTSMFQTKTHLSERHQVLDESASQASPDLIREIQVQPIVSNSDSDNPATCVSGDHFIYISNPIYSNDGTSKPDTPFETPESSPSRLETGDSSSGEDSVVVTPELTPMKELPEKACSVSLRDARSLETSASDSNSNNGGSFSSSGSRCTSPSW
ncbi:PREDICTED: uncharacterized protein LOC104811107 [Tarenaya hassleriana]|uniref:uncharacterized protein LOC104811107 n=1 Tax=Tarenaya hassleriana TaxID=28532 RepID=UPI00053C5F93|nr:PREDICTED: uncharacterized protein LOC104811107 [Tarenaya hassleriana]